MKRKYSRGEQNAYGHERTKRQNYYESPSNTHDVRLIWYVVSQKSGWMMDPFFALEPPGASLGQSVNLDLCAVPGV